MGRKKNPPSAKVVKETFPLDNFMKLIFKKFKLTDRQKEFLSIAFDPNTKVVFLSGPSGSSKTFCSIYAALHLFNMDQEKEIIYVRTTAESGDRSLGFLPGPQPLYSKVLTKNGWVKMGDLKIGDKVIAWDGKEVGILGIYDKGVKSVYELTTTDDRKARSCEDHLWMTETAEERKRGKKGEIRSLKEINNTLLGSSSNKILSKRYNHALPKINAIDLEEKKLPIPPYSLGALLGDGSLGNHISFFSIDKEIPNRLKEELKELNCRLTEVEYENNFFRYTICCDEFKNNKVSKVILCKNKETEGVIKYESVNECLSNFKDLNKNKLNSLCKSGKEYENFTFSSEKAEIKYTNALKNKLFELGLLKKTHLDKFIPEVYLNSSAQQRLDLLRGLMDTDGCSKEHTGEAMFYNTSIELCKGVQSLVRSLGGNCTIREAKQKTKRIGTPSSEKYNIIQRHPCYTCYIGLPGDINPFYLKRKSERFYNNFIHRSCIKSIEYIEDSEVRCIKIDHPDHLYITDDYIVTHNTSEDKLNPFTIPLLDKLEEIVGRDSAKELVAKRIATASPINFLRGVSWNNKLVILDESQNATYKELVTFLTRIGKETKYFLCGDLMQSDINGKSGLKKVIDTFDTKEAQENGIHVFNFTKEDIMRSEILKFIVEELEKNI